MSLPVEQSRGGLLTRCALHCPAARQEEDAWSLSSLPFYGLIWMCANSQLSFSYFTGLVGYPLVQHILRYISDTIRSVSHLNSLEREWQWNKGGFPRWGWECLLASPGPGSAVETAGAGFSPAGRGRGQQSELCPLSRRWGSSVSAEGRGRVYYGSLGLEDGSFPCRGHESTSDGKWFLNSCPGGRELMLQPHVGAGPVRMLLLLSYPLLSLDAPRCFRSSR